jgi:outer membrane protein assembly factor BamB
MYLLDSAGEVVRRDHSCRWVRALAVSPSGETVVCGSGHKNLYCFDRQGETRWGAATRGAVSSIAVADGNGPIFAATYPRDGLLYAFDRRGSLLWSHDLGGMGIVSTDLSGGFAIAGSSRGNIMAFSSTGTTLWTRQLGAPIVDISVSPDASLVAIAAGSGSGVVHFLSSDGANVGEIRSQDLPLKVGFSPSGQTATIVTKAQMHGVCHVLVAE